MKFWSRYDKILERLFSFIRIPFLVEGILFLCVGIAILIKFKGAIWDKFLNLF